MCIQLWCYFQLKQKVYTSVLEFLANFDLHLAALGR